MNNLIVYADTSTAGESVESEEGGFRTALFYEVSYLRIKFFGAYSFPYRFFGDKQARNEKQPNKKFELAQKVRALQKQLVKL